MLRHSPFCLSRLTLAALLTLACRPGARAADVGAADVGAADAGNGASARDVRAATGVAAGLAVHLGTTDGTLEAALAREGRVLVHGIALDDASLAAARRSIRGEGLCGLACVERGVLDPLPYADNLVNLVVADGDQLASRGFANGFSMGQVMRVLAPGGQAYVKQSGRWTRTIKPRPAAMDDWGHFDHDAQGNGVSHDKLVKPPNFIQWVDDIQAITLGGNPAAYRPFTSFRCQGGRAYFEWSTGIEKGSREKQKQQFYSGRDAFNGLPLWDVTNTTTGDRKEMQFVAAGDQLFAFLQKAGPLVALDGATGKVLRTYDAGGPLTDDPRRTCVRYAGETLIESSGDTLYALDTRGGALKWKYVAKDADVLFPVVAPGEAAGEAAEAGKAAPGKAEAPGRVPGEGKVFATLADPPTRGSSRWPVAKTLALVCLDLKTGKVLWRNDELKGAYVGQIVYHEGHLALFASAAIGGGDDGQSFVGDLDPSDGKLRWRTTFKKSWNVAGYNMIVRDRSVYYADAWRVHGLGLEAGEEKMAFDGGGYNQRCNRFSATDDYFMFGLVTYVDKNATGDVFEHHPQRLRPGGGPRQRADLLHAKRLPVHRAGARLPGVVARAGRRAGAGRKPARQVPAAGAGAGSGVGPRATGGAGRRRLGARAEVRRAGNRPPGSGRPHVRGRHSRAPAGVPGPGGEGAVVLHGGRPGLLAAGRERGPLLLRLARRLRLLPRRRRRQAALAVPGRPARA